MCSTFFVLIIEHMKNKICMLLLIQENLHFIVVATYIVSE